MFTIYYYQCKLCNVKKWRNPIIWPTVSFLLTFLWNTGSQRRNSFNSSIGQPQRRNNLIFYFFHSYGQRYFTTQGFTSVILRLSFYHIRWIIARQSHAQKILTYQMAEALKALSIGPNDHLEDHVVSTYNVCRRLLTTHSTQRLLLENTVSQ